MKDVFISTENFQRFEALYEELLAPGHGVELGGVVGRPGRGKSTSAKRIVAMSASAVYIRCDEWMTTTELLRDVAFAIAGVRPGLSRQCKEIIRDEMARSRRVILVDEADRLGLRHMNGLRDLHDQFYAPVIFIGLESLKTKFLRDDRLDGRVRAIVEYKPVNQTDVSVFYRQALDMAVKPDHAAALARHCRGDFRRVVQDALKVERILESSGLKEITAGVIKEICNGGK